jgi:hypothetical protein
LTVVLQFALVGVKCRSNFDLHLGAANDGDILEYEIRQEVIHEICNQLANSTAA